MKEIMRKEANKDVSKKKHIGSFQLHGLVYYGAKSNVFMYLRGHVSKKQHLLVPVILINIKK